MPKPIRLWALVFAIIFLCIFFTGNRIVAQPAVELSIDPDIRTISLDAAKEIAIIARMSQQDVQFTWNLQGPGELLGEATGPGRLYTPPTNLSKTATAAITVTVTDAEGKQATASVTFTLVAPPSPPPILTPTATPAATPPPSIIPPHIRKIVLKDTKDFFINLPEDGRYRLKPGENVRIEVIVDNPSKQIYTVNYVPKRGSIQSNLYLAPDKPGESDTLLIKVLTNTEADTQSLEIKIIDVAAR